MKSLYRSVASSHLSSRTRSVHPSGGARGVVRARAVFGVVILGLAIGCASVPEFADSEHRTVRFRHDGDGMIMVSVRDRVATLSGHAVASLEVV